jgi:transaldolase/glucose-6-phosphate isomerase
LTSVDTAELVERIWARDATLWTGQAEAHWLGWLDEPLRMQERLPEVLAFAEAASGFADVVLLGMGGSSLAPEVLATLYGPQEGYPQLTVLENLKLDELITREYDLEDINTAFTDMRDGKNIRGVIVYE